MYSKISLNVSENLLKWLDRFKSEGDTEQFAAMTRTDIFQQDISFYANLLTEGMLSITQKITYDGFICLIGAFNGWFPTHQITSGQIKFMIGEYDTYNPEFAWNCKAKEIDKDELLETVNNFNAMECYALLEYSRRFWHKSEKFDVDEIMNDIGLTKDRFKQSNN